MEGKGPVSSVCHRTMNSEKERFRFIIAYRNVCACVCVHVPGQCCSSSAVDVLRSSEEQIVHSKPLPSPPIRHTQTHTHTHSLPPTHLLWNRHMHTHTPPAPPHPPHRYGVSSFLLTMTDMPVAAGLSVSQSSLQGAASEQRHAGRLQPVVALG